MAIYFNLFFFSISDLHGAARRGDLEELKRLVEGGHDVNQRDRWETTPLMFAAQKGHTDCVKFLLQNGAHFNMFDAAKIGMLEWLKRLVDGGGDVNQRDGYLKRTPLMWAAGNGHTDCVEYLIQNGAKLDLKDEDGWTALHYAALGGHLEVMKKLVEGGQDVNEGDFRGRTPLMLAARRGRTDCVEYLLQNGARLHLKDNKYKTALNYAAGHSSTVKLLQTAAHKGE